MDKQDQAVTSCVHIVMYLERVYPIHHTAAIKKSHLQVLSWPRQQDTVIITLVKKSQDQIVKFSYGVKEMPITSTEPSQEVPDALHLDINVTQHLVEFTVECICMVVKRMPSSSMRKLKERRKLLK